MQDVFLFSATIEENIMYGIRCYQGRCNKGCKIAAAHDFIMEMPQGMTLLLVSVVWAYPRSAENCYR